MGKKNTPPLEASQQLTDAHRVKRGKALDDIQSRIADLKRQGKEIPEEWKERVAQLAESDDAAEVETQLAWLENDLPPKEYMTEEITWRTFNHFSFALLDRLTIYAMRCELLSSGGKSLAIDIMATIAAIRHATESPVVAMAELAKARSQTKFLPDFEEHQA